MEFVLGTDGSERLNSILYKYYRIDERFKSLLKNSEVWFSDPLGFNDPYDCNLVIDSTNTYDEIFNHLKDIRVRREDELKKQGLDLSDEHIEKTADYWSKNPDRLEESLKRNQLFEIQNKGMTCFSKSDKIFLMWSHYADSHKGACLTFDIEKDKDFFWLPYIVEYPDTYPKINFVKEKDIHKRYKHVLAMKSKDWEYEQEVRIVRDRREQKDFRGNIKFKKEALTEIKFGYKTDNKTIEEIKKEIAILGYGHVQLFKAELKKNDFGLTFKEWL
jgi:hypothetical protein